MAAHQPNFRSQAPKPIITTFDNEYDEPEINMMSPEERAYQDFQLKSPPPAPPVVATERVNEAGEQIDGDEALLDLAQLEELHQEAERMKALGNKHMAAQVGLERSTNGLRFGCRAIHSSVLRLKFVISQEYGRAYNAYSAALQLSPVGPSSHVFLSNRAASLLSMKKYGEAATDARRAVALAPTFGKAHARLGQSLYFLKDYDGAVAAYEEAVRYEPDNDVTQTYLEKARSKLYRQKEKARRQARGEEISVAEESMPFTVANSIATDPNKGAAVVTSGFRGSSQVLMNAIDSREMPSEVATGQPQPTTPITPMTAEASESILDDPDFDEAVRIQERGNRFLAMKRYRSAIEEYSAALFLVPDDPYLSPDLHLGRAHALNGSRRHESACNDAMLAIRIRPTPEAYSTLAKSRFYMKEYAEAIEAFEQCTELLPTGENLSMFDQAYLKKSQEAWRQELENDDTRSVGTARSSKSNKSIIPKLPPPRFVPREEVSRSCFHPRKFCRTTRSRCG